VTSAAPTACRNCVPVGEEPDAMCSSGLPKWAGICRPPLAGSSAARHRLEQLVERALSERQRERAVAVIEEEPVVTGAQVLAERDADPLVARARRSGRTSCSAA
jgi:hypothetical protein